jgi:hypothetical protein
VTVSVEPANPLVKDMAGTWEDILRLLPVALRGWPYRVDGTTVEVGSPDRGATISVGPLPPRQFGLVQIPRSRVALAFHGLDPGEQEAFLRQFDRAFQRGGG